jgi:hypothetical protein
MAVYREIKAKTFKNGQNPAEIGHSQPIMMVVDKKMCCLQLLMMAVDKNIFQEISLLTFENKREIWVI